MYDIHNDPKVVFVTDARAEELSEQLGVKVITLGDGMHNLLSRKGVTPVFINSIFSSPVGDDVVANGVTDYVSLQYKQDGVDCSEVWEGIVESKQAKSGHPTYLVKCLGNTNF